MSKCPHELCEYWDKERGSCVFFVAGSGEVEDMPCYVAKVDDISHCIEIAELGALQDKPGYVWINKRDHGSRHSKNSEEAVK